MNFFYKTLLLFNCLIISVCAYGHNYRSEIERKADVRYFSFIENKGQWLSEIKYKAEIPGGAMFVTDSGFVYHFISESDMEHIHNLSMQGKETHQEAVHHHAYNVSFVGANLHPIYRPTEKRPYYYNYFLGNKPDKWAGRVALFGNILLEHVYDGIDMQLYSKKGNLLKYDFIVSPGANPATIKLAFNGVQPRLTKGGNLLLRTSVSEVIENAPYCYQVIDGKQVTVKSRFMLDKQTLFFDFPEGYSKDYPLIIDPDLVFSTYSGGTGGHHYGQSATYDMQGNMYAGALSTSAGWPVTIGAFQTGGTGLTTAINKYSPDGANLLYATYYGGSGTDVPNTMRVNSKNELIIAGATSSFNLPLSTNAYQKNPGGNTDIFVAHFSENGDRLIGATYVGGTNEEPRSLDVAVPGPAAQNGAQSVSPVEIDFDREDNIWVVSNTTAFDFPITPNALQHNINGGFDAVLFQLDTACSQLMYSTFLGGSKNDAAFGIAMNSRGNIVICGGTQSPDFATTPGTLHTTTPGGLWDGFVAIIDATTKSLLHATFLGTAATDNAVKLQVDCNDNVYVFGRNVFGSASDSYPIATGVWNMPLGDIFIDKLTPNLSASLLSTVFGKERTSPYDGFYPTAFMIDDCGRSYIAGVTVNPRPKLPVTADALDKDEKKFWFCVLDPGFSNLRYASYFGEQGDDHMHSGTSRFDPTGFLYQSLCTVDAGFPTTQGSWSPSKKNSSSGNDLVSFKFDFKIRYNDFDLTTIGSQGALDSIPHCVRGCKPGIFTFSRKHPDATPITIHYTISGSAINGVDYQHISDSIVIPANRTDTVLKIFPLLAATATGVKDVVIRTNSSCACVQEKEARLLIYDSLFVKILTPPDTICYNTQIAIQAAIDSTLQFRWGSSDFIPDPLPLGLTIHPRPLQTSIYIITVTQPGAPPTCPARQIAYQAVVKAYPKVVLPSDTSFCINGNDSVSLNVLTLPYDGEHFIWQPSIYFRDNYSQHNKFWAPAGNYIITVTATNSAGCASTDSMNILVIPPLSITVSPVDTIIKYGDAVRLSVEGAPMAWQWIPETYLDSPKSLTPTARPLELIVYRFIGSDRYGCKDTAEVRIKPKYVFNTYIPNAFSPNGDGRNDLFSIKGITVEKILVFKIFNRYGQEIFSDTKQGAGWDGNFKGAPCEVGTYYYLFQLSYPDGDNKSFTGDVTLIR